ncbi:hypothetical protein WJX84_009960 [Apatococcus fuscideae]|uniref:Uncharacterized protein n=1 Tax=Apatococcus fuscideae TaxID=2026836 RepID=A0AAW1SE86_9CHLO
MMQVSLPPAGLGATMLNDAQSVDGTALGHGPQLLTADEAHGREGLLVGMAPGAHLQFMDRVTTPGQPPHAASQPADAVQGLPAVNGQASDAVTIQGPGASRSRGTGAQGIITGGLQQLAQHEAASAAANLGLDSNFTAAISAAQEEAHFLTQEAAGLARPGRRRVVQNNVVQTAASKVCAQCNQELQAAHFRLDRTQRDGLRSKCKACAPVKAPQGRKRHAPEPSAQAGHKVCRNCNEEKLTSAFPHKRNSIDKLDYHCKACHIAATAERVSRRGLVEVPAVENKVCSKCEKELPADSFHKDRNKSDGLRGRCRACEALSQTVRRVTRAPVDEPTVTSKVCRRCGEEKAATDFCRKKQRTDGLDSYCKDCNCKATAARTARKAPTVAPTVEHKVCVRCHQDKPAGEFPARPSATDGLYSYCRICRTESANSSRLRVRSRQALQADQGSEVEEAPMDMRDG